MIEMNKTVLISFTILCLLFAVFLTGLSSNIQPVRASGTIYIRSDGSIEGTDRIQRDGNVYTFTDNIYDSIVVERDSIVVDGTGFILRGTGAQNSKGVALSGKSNVTIRNMIIETFWTGIWLNMSLNINISGNLVTNNIGLGGIWLSNSSSNLISENDVMSNGNRGIQLFDSFNNTIYSNDISESNVEGVFLSRSSNNTISGNNLTRNDRGVSVHAFSHCNLISGNYIANNEEYGVVLTVMAGGGNIISGNTIASNGHGISLWSYGNFAYHNNFVNNTQQCMYASTNTWDDGYPSGGNYWSDYTGVDSDSDGIGDTPYIIDEVNQDNYPSMGMFSDFNVAWEKETYYVTTICNSTISDFQFNGTAICFDVTGEDETTGSCRICIPTLLMYDTYRVFVNGTEVQHTLLPCSNITHSYLYFAYPHSTQEIMIVPEFPSFLVLPLFMIATLLAAMLYRRKHST